MDAISYIKNIPTTEAPPDWNSQGSDTSSEPKHLRAAAEAARQRWPGCCESAALNDISMEALAHEACECPADALSQPKGRQALSVSSSSPERDCSESHEIQQLKMKLAEMERNVQVARDERVEAVRTAVEAQQGQMAAMHSEREALAAQEAVWREAGQSQRNGQGMRLRKELEEEARRLKSRCRLECEEQAAARIAAEGRLRRCEEDAEDKSEQYQQKIVQLRRKFVQLRGQAQGEEQALRDRLESAEARASQQASTAEQVLLRIQQESDRSKQMDQRRAMEQEQIRQEVEKARQIREEALRGAERARQEVEAAQREWKDARQKALELSWVRDSLQEDLERLHASGKEQERRLMQRVAETKRFAEHEEAVVARERRARKEVADANCGLKRQNDLLRRELHEALKAQWARQERPQPREQDARAGLESPDGQE